MGVKLTGEELALAQSRSAKVLYKRLMHKLRGAQDKYCHHAIEKHKAALERFYDKNPEYLI